MTYTLLVLFGLVAQFAQAAMGNSIDNSTFSNIDQVHSTHLYLDIEVDFGQKVFMGSV